MPKTNNCKHCEESAILHQEFLLTTAARISCQHTTTTDLLLLYYYLAKVNSLSIASSIKDLDIHRCRDLYHHVAWTMIAIGAAICPLE